MHFLVVDDSTTNLIVIFHILEKLGFSAQTANSGDEALELLKDSKVVFDFVIIDLYMPGKSGIETTKIIRNVLNLKNIPIIALTASESNDTRVEAFKSGMNGYIIKPITSCKILDEIKKYLQS